jgi:hypothetical protein
MLLKYAAPTRFECRHCRCQLPLGDASSVPGSDPKLPITFPNGPPASGHSVGEWVCPFTTKNARAGKR